MRLPSTQAVTSTVDGHKKAAYNTFELFNRLQPTLLTTTASGTGTADNAVGAIATKDPATGKVTLLAWNDQPSGTDLTLRLDNLPYPGQRKNLRVTQYLLDATHGNYYKDYADGLRGWSVGPTENADPVDSRIVAGRSTFSRSLTVGPHSVVAYVLEPTRAAATNVQQLGPATVPVTRNLAQGRQVTASSSVPWGWSTASLVDGLTHTFTRVDNGAPSNGWSSNGHPTADATEWVYVDLTSPAKLERVKLFPRDDKECEGYAFPIDFTIQSSKDATNWTTLATRTNYNGGEPLAMPTSAQTFDVSGSFRYVRVHATKLQLACAGDNTRYFQVAELQVESGANLASGAALSSSSADQVTVRHPASTGVSRVDVQPANDGRGFPRDFAIQVAANDACTAWSTVAVHTGNANPDRFRRTFGFPSRTARCVRVQATDGRFRQGLPEVMLYH